MAEKELIPGLYVKNEGDDLAEIREMIAREEADRKLEDANRSTTLVSEAVEAIKNGYEVKITDEMHELGIANKVLEMCFRADNNRKLNRLGSDDAEDRYSWLD